MPFQILPQPPLTSTAATPLVTSNSDDLVNEVTATSGLMNIAHTQTRALRAKYRLPDLKDCNDGFL